jgi:hypothetical protein
MTPVDQWNIAKPGQTLIARGQSTAQRLTERRLPAAGEPRRSILHEPLAGRFAATAYDGRVFVSYAASRGSKHT